MFNFWKSSIPVGCKFGDSKFNNWLSTVYSVATNATISLIRKYCDVGTSITFSGGCAQNSVLNESLYKIYGNKIFIPPHAYDGGLSLGALEFLRLLYNVDKFSTKGFPFWQQDEILEKPSLNTINEISEMLSHGKIIGWFQGKGEIGPRALGNRSILMNPSLTNGKDVLNHSVKNREFWRPYAPSVLDFECNNWFDCASSPYMLRTVKVKDDKKEFIPSVVHVDDTSRIQSVSESINPAFFMLINSFYERTGIPMLLNTSLNCSGQPIFSTKKQCLNMLKKTHIDAICIGDVIYKKNKFL